MSTYWALRARDTQTVKGSKALGPQNIGKGQEVRYNSPQEET